MAKKKTAPKKKTSKKTSAAKKKAPKKTTKRSAAPGKDNFEPVRRKLQTLLEKPKTEKKVLKLLLGLDESQRRELSPT